MKKYFFVYIINKYAFCVDPAAFHAQTLMKQWPLLRPGAAMSNVVCHKLHFYTRSFFLTTESEGCNQEGLLDTYM